MSRKAGRPQTVPDIVLLELLPATVKEVAAVTGLSVDAVRYRLKKIAHRHRFTSTGRWGGSGHASDIWSEDEDWCERNNTQDFCWEHAT